jgi:hypothetical protein
MQPKGEFKSTLIREAIKDRTHVFYQATRVTSSLNLESFNLPVVEALCALPDRPQRCGGVKSIVIRARRKSRGRKQLIIAAVTTDICLVFPTISAVEAGYEVQAMFNASGSSFAIGEETSRRRMERVGVWLTSTNTMVAELVGNWATRQGMALVPLLAADPPMLPVY